MKKSLIFCMLFIGLCSSTVFSATTPDEALTRLKEGNSRYVKEKSEHPDVTPARRLETAKEGQHPFATVLSCSDSRVPVEVIFDQGIGDIFVVRVAGNVCGESEIGSIEYGVEHTGTPVLVVLGHSQCGAVTAAATHAEAGGHIKSLVQKIEPSVMQAQHQHPDLHGKDLIPSATEANVWHSIEELFEHSPEICESVASGKAKVVGAIYDISNGEVHWLGEHPDQHKLLETKEDN